MGRETSSVVGRGIERRQVRVVISKVVNAREVDAEKRKYTRGKTAGTLYFPILPAIFAWWRA